MDVCDLPLGYGCANLLEVKSRHNVARCSDSRCQDEDVAEAEDVIEGDVSEPPLLKTRLVEVGVVPE